MRNSCWDNRPHYIYSASRGTSHCLRSQRGKDAASHSWSLDGHRETLVQDKPAMDKSILVNIRLMMHRTEYSPVQKLEGIYENLRPDYQMFTRRHEFATLEQLTALLVNYEVTRDQDIGNHARRMGELQPSPKRTDHGIPVYSGEPPMSRQDVTPTPRRTPVQAAAISEQIPRVGNLSTVPNFRLACRSCAEDGHLSQECRNPRVFFCWDCGCREMRTVECCRRTRSGNEGSLRHLGERSETARRNPQT